MFDDANDATLFSSLHCLCIAVSLVKQDWVMTAIRVGPPLVGLCLLVCLSQTLEIQCDVKNNQDDKQCKNQYQGSCRHHGTRWVLFRSVAHCALCSTDMTLTVYAEQRGLFESAVDVARTKDWHLP